MQTQVFEEDSNKLSPQEQFVVDHLKGEFFNRVQKNSRYSLRAFAQFLKIDQSHLSKILANKVRLSEKMIFHLSSVLEINPSKLQASNVPYNTIEDQIFEIIGNWIHFAIMELIKTDGFKYDVLWISKRLGVHRDEVDLAIKRLQHVGVIEVDNKKQIKLKDKNLNWNSDIKTNFARKNLQKELLKKAIDCIDRVDFVERENSSLTFAVPQVLIPELKKEITKFKNKIDRLAEIQKKKTRVYQLCVALFPLSDQ